MSDLSVLLQNVGLTSGQAIGFAIIIAIGLVSAHAARSSSRESKRQYRANQRVEQLSAAGSLMLGLNEFEQQLEQRLYDNLNCSQMFDHHTTINGVKLPKDANELAAKFGDDILVSIIILEAKRVRAIRTIDATLAILGPEDAENEVIKHSSILIFGAVDLMKKLSFHFGASNIVEPPIAYIGEAQRVYDRLLDHVRKKDFWNEAVLFVNKDDNMHIKYLEARLIDEAERAGRYFMDNHRHSHGRATF